MQKKNVIILFILSILFFSLSFLGVYVYGYEGNPGHSADYIGSGSFGSQVSGDTGNYIFNNGGSVGIGTTNPQYKLHISGTLGASQFIATDLWIKRNADSSVLRITGGTNLSFVTDGIRGAGIILQGKDYGGTDAGGSLHLYALSGQKITLNHSTKDGGATTRMIIDGSGNVGIGTTSPAQKLHIYSNVADTAGGIVRVDAGNNFRGDWYAWRTSDNTNGGVVINSYRDGTGYKSLILEGSPIILSQGNVGIGTGSPGHRLTVGGLDSLPPLPFPNSITVGFSNQSDSHDTLGVYNSSRGNTALRVVSSNAVSYAGYFQAATYNDSHPLVAVNMKSSSSGAYLRIQSSSGIIYLDSSSKEIKEDIKPLKDDFYKILKIQAKSFIDKPTKNKEIGYIAEEIDAIGLKNLVNYRDNKPNGVKYEKIPIYLLEIIKDQQKEIEKLEKRLEDLKKSNCLSLNQNKSFWERLFGR